MLTPRRGAMVWPGTSSARDLGTISWRMNAVCEPLDHDSCRSSEDQWRKRNKDLGCLSQWERSKIAGWVKEHPTGREVIDRWKREDLSPEESTILRSTSITGRRTTVEELSTYACQRTISKKFPHIDTGVLPDCASTSDLPQDTRGKHTGVIRTTSTPRN